MDAFDRPKAAPKPCPSGAMKPRNAKTTIREFLTDDETNLGIISLLKQTAKLKSKGPWRDYLEFFSQNQSGDFYSVKPEIRAYLEKMKKDLRDEKIKNQTEETEDAIQKQSTATKIRRASKTRKNEPKDVRRVEQSDGKQETTGTTQT